MKKICILQNSMTFGGTDTFAINLCKGLVSDGYEVTVVLSVDRNEMLPREQELLSTKVQVIKTCHLRGTKSKIIHLLLLFNELRRGKYDVFQSNIDLFNGPQIFVSWLAGVPVRVCHSHNSQQGKELSEGRTITIRIYQRVMRWLCWTFSNRRCGCSKQALDFLFMDKWKSDCRSKVIHNGIDLDEYQKPIDKNQKRMDLGLSISRFIICTVGRISFQKNPEFLLEIFYELTKIRNDVDLVWCGNGEVEDLISKKIESYMLKDRVHMLGVRNDIPEILRASDLFLLPSRFEGLGIVLVEAQAAGLTCVMSDVVPSEVNCGLGLPISLENNSEYWASEINNILNGKLHLNLNIKKLNAYSIEEMVKEMEEVFE